MPKAPVEFIDLNKIGHGAMFRGSRGVLVSDFTTRVLLPSGARADMTYYEPRAESELIPRLGQFQKEWINACKGDLKTSCNFDYAGKLNEMMLLGLVAYRVGKKLDYDGAAGRVTNSKEGNDLLRREYRKGWTL